MRIWRFGLYYFFVFGGFVALAQWLVPYYVNAYGTTVVLAGALTAIFSFPSGVIRALGGWMSDRWGARTVLYWVFGLSIICCGLLIVPQMDIHAPGSGVMTRQSGTVLEITEHSIVVESPNLGKETYVLVPKGKDIVSREERHSGMLIFPRSTSWQEPVVVVGERVGKGELLARGVTHIFFQANIWIFTALCFIIGSVMGIGKAAVYKHIPEYFPEHVGVVGGMVGVLGGLGGFAFPVTFGYLLRGTGLWTTSWMFLLLVAAAGLFWMHRVIRKSTREQAPELLRRIE
jgi:NNP family nitrate/nitrite transporter-like MFS transporter